MKSKGVIGIIAVFVLLMFLYNSFFKPEAVPASGQQVSSNIGSDLLKTSEKLNRVTLNQSLFSDAGYLLLVDFSTDIIPQSVGRPNPFNVIGRD